MNRSLIVLAALATVATPIAAEPSSSTPNRAPPVRTTVYFLADGGRGVVGVRRTLARRSPLAREALSALVAGPTKAERRRGITTAIPATARVRSFRLSPPIAIGGVMATVDLSGLTLNFPTTAPLERAATQIARTLIGVSDVRRVRLRANGRPWPFRTHAGTIVDRLVDYERMLGWTRVCPLVTRRTSCFSALP